MLHRTVPVPGSGPAPGSVQAVQPQRCVGIPLAHNGHCDIFSDPVQQNITDLHWIVVLELGSRLYGSGKGLCTLSSEEIGIFQEILVVLHTVPGEFEPDADYDVIVHADGASGVQHITVPVGSRTLPGIVINGVVTPVVHAPVLHAVNALVEGMPVQGAQTHARIRYAASHVVPPTFLTQFLTFRRIVQMILRVRGIPYLPCPVKRRLDSLRDEMFQIGCICVDDVVEVPLQREGGMRVRAVAGACVCIGFVAVIEHAAVEPTLLAIMVSHLLYILADDVAVVRARLVRRLGKIIFVAIPSHGIVTGDGKLEPGEVELVQVIFKQGVATCEIDGHCVLAVHSEITSPGFDGAELSGGYSVGFEFFIYVLHELHMFGIEVIEGIVGVVGAGG